MTSCLWTSKEIATLTGGLAEEAFEVNAVHFDSRQVRPGALFVALRGIHSDGHDHVADALDAGAAGALVSRQFDLATEHESKLIKVDDVAEALNALATTARGRMQSPVIGITGSAGKTGTKEALLQALGRVGFVHGSEKSYNNHVGVPISLTRMPAAAEFGVFELGMNAPGEIDALGALVQPDVAIITSIGLAHRAGFETDADIARAKAELFAHVRPGGSIILPSDIAHRDVLEPLAIESPAERVIWTSLEDSTADVYAERMVEHETCSCMTVRVFDQCLTFKIAQPGRHWAANSLNVLAAVALAEGDLALAGVALAQMRDVDGRGARHSVNIDDLIFTLIDESYNANPLSMNAALEVLANTTPPGCAAGRVAVLGDMEELGDAAEAAHGALGDKLLSLGIDRLFAYGPHMARVAAQVSKHIEAEAFDDKAALLDALRRRIRLGDLVMIKGSNAQKLSEVVQGLMALGESKELEGQRVGAMAAAE